MALIEIDVFEEHCSKAEKETLRLLRLILNNHENIMSQIDDLNTALAGIQTTVTGLAADAQTLEDALTAAIAANPGVDLSGPLATAQAINASLSSVGILILAVSLASHSHSRAFLWWKFRHEIKTLAFCSPVKIAENWPIVNKIGRHLHRCCYLTAYQADSVLDLSQRVLAAFRAIALRVSGVNAAARARPLLAVAGFSFSADASPIDCCTILNASVFTSMRLLSDYPALFAMPVRQRCRSNQYLLSYVFSNRTWPCYSQTRTVQRQQTTETKRCSPLRAGAIVTRKPLESGSILAMYDRPTP